MYDIEMIIKKGIMKIGHDREPASSSERLLWPHPRLYFYITNVQIVLFKPWKWLYRITEDIIHSSVFEISQFTNIFMCHMISSTFKTIFFQVSMLILAFMSVERFLLIVNPLSGYARLNSISARKTMIIIWCTGIVLAILPSKIHKMLHRNVSPFCNMYLLFSSNLLEELYHVLWIE